MQGNVIERHRKLLSAGIDWLTCSKSGGVDASLFQTTAQIMLLKSCTDGETPKLGTWQGYAGLQSSTAFVGMAGDNALVRLSGPHSPALTTKLITAADNVSRLDLQMTVELDPPDAMFGKIEFRQLADYDHNAGRKPVVTVIHNTHGSHTNAVGSRLSDAYGRSYDKGIESGNVVRGKFVRYEVEYKRHLAKKIASQIALSDKVVDVAARTVYRYWARKGLLPLPTEPKGGLIDQAHPKRLDPEYLGYLSRNIRTPVRRAIDMHGLEPVLDALGLLDYYRREGGL